MNSIKRTVSILIIISLLAALPAVLSGCLFLRSSEYRRGPAMWVVSDADGNVCYLFGSIHVGKNDKMFPFPDIIEDAYNSCGALALEYDIKEAELQYEKYTEEDYKAYYSQFIYADGSTVKDHLGAETYEQAVGFLKKRGVYEEAYDSYNAMYWYLIIENLISAENGEDPDYGVDRYFVEKAYAEEKTVFSIESEQEQLDMLLSVDDRVFDSMISSLINSEKSIFGSGFSTALLLSLYKTGDMDTMSALMDASRKADYEDKELAAAMLDFDKKMYTDRNRKMADTVKQYLADGERVFVVVGAAHMLGDDGIVALLTAEGYNVYRK